jgi:hypothetical protein
LPKSSGWTIPFFVNQAHRAMNEIVKTIRFHLTNNTNGNGFYAAVQFAESIWTPQTSFKYVQEIRDGQPWWDCY